MTIIDRVRPGSGSRWFVPISTTMVAAAAVAIALVSASTSMPDASGTSPAQIQPVDMHLSASDQAQWQSQIATPAGRAQVLDAMESAFAGMATVGVGTPATPSQSSDATGQIQRVAYTGGPSIRPEWATGITGDHFWITASYADIVNGSISGAVWACKKRVAAWLCDTAGNLLQDWARGWGSANDHGVWAAVYWWPPHVTGGRW